LRRAEHDLIQLQALLAYTCGRERIGLVVSPAAFVATICQK
jgi:hypothetical protein